VTIRKAPRPRRPPATVVTPIPAPVLSRAYVESLPELVADLDGTDRGALARAILRNWDEDFAGRDPRVILDTVLTSAFDGRRRDGLFEQIVERRWRALIGSYLGAVLKLGERMMEMDATGGPRIAAMTLAFLRTHALFSEELDDIAASHRLVKNVLLWWLAAPPFAADALAIGLVALLEKRAGQVKCPALPNLIVEPLARALSGGAIVGDDGGALIVKVGRDRVGRLVPGLADHARLRERAERGFGSLAAHRLLRFLLARAWERTAIDQAADAHIVRVDEGWSGVARALGLEGRKGANAVQAAGEALASLRLDGDLDGQLLRIESRRTRGAGDSMTTTVSLELLGALRPGFVHTMRRMSLDRRLVPLPHVVGPLTSGTKTQAAQSSFQMLFLRELHLRARDFDEERCVQIPRRRLDELGHRVGLDERGVSSSITAWTDRTKGPFIVRSSDDRYRLAERYAQLDEHIAQFAQISLAARARSARRKKARH
jgi:hypothetical protein